MGSLPLPQPPAATPSSPGNNMLPTSLVYVAFCTREPGPSNDVFNWIECYSPSLNTWSYVSSIPGLMENHVLKGFAMVSLGDWVYIIGGQLCKKERVHVSDESAELVDMGVAVSSMVWRYNIRTNKWSLCTSLNLPRYDFACTVCDNKIYVACGKSTLTAARGISSAEVYDPDMDNWSPLPNLSVLRYKCVGVTWEGRVYVIGGFAEREDSDCTLPSLVERSSAEMFDTQAQRWDLIPRMWQLDIPPNQIVALNGKLFSSGDCLNAWKGHIEAYDGKLRLWNEVEGSPQRNLSTFRTNHDDDSSQDIAYLRRSNRRVYLTMAPIGNYLCFLAGYRLGEDYSTRTMSTVHIFNTSAITNPWKSLEPMELEGEKELCGHCCVVQLIQ